MSNEIQELVKKGTDIFDKNGEVIEDNLTIIFPLKKHETKTVKKGRGIFKRYVKVNTLINNSHYITLRHNFLIVRFMADRDVFIFDCKYRSCSETVMLTKEIVQTDIKKVVDIVYDRLKYCQKRWVHLRNINVTGEVFVKPRKNG